MRGLFATAILVLCAGQANAGAGIAISPTYAQIVKGQTLQFSANADAIWQVNNATGGNKTWGTISASGLYTAPAKLPVPQLVTITAVEKANPDFSATAVVTLLAKAATGTTHYVATTGNDSNSGSIDAPWKTVQHAADTAAAGDTVLVRDGVYNEHVNIHISGNANNFITFANYPGETATLDGTGLTIPGGQWGMFTVQDAGYVILEGFDIRNYQSTSDNKVPIGIWVEGAGTAVQLVNNSVHDIVTTGPANPTNCASDAFGITVDGSEAPAAIDQIAIAGNDIFNNKLGCSETMSLDGNVTNFLVASNNVHDDDNIAIGAIGFEKVAPDPAYDQARDGVIRGNTVYNITSYGNPDYGKQYAADGIYVDGGTNIVIEQNLIHNVDLGIEMASEHQGKVSSLITARNNIIYSGNSAGISIGGYAAKRGGTDHVTIVNNTLYNNDTQNTGSGEFQIQFNATNNVFENNIVYAGAQDLLVNDFTTSEPDPAVLDYNLYFSGDAANAIWDWQKHNYKGYDAYRTGTGMDADSPPFSDPIFKSPPDNFDIAASSPARRTGIVLGAAINGTYDFAGNKRIVSGKINIGAYQK